MVCIKRLRKKGCKESKCHECDKWNIVHEEGREVIQQWREKRLHIRGARKSYHEFLIYTFTLDTLKSFCQNINLMVVIQMIMAITSVYIFQAFNISFNIPVPILVSPIVFPLAFSINTDFQRREKVLEDLAVFKSCGMIWYFCMREWKKPAELDSDWIYAVHCKLKSLLFHLREYLLTYKLERRKIILRAMYEDFSDANQLIEKVRASNLPANTAIVSRSVHLLNMMCLSFERLRVIREYRSPRSIRSFNKVFIMFLPIILAPYFLYLGIKSKNTWEPYYISTLVAFVFSSLQSVQDKLDDPFGGMSEDDIDLDTIDEWTFSSLEHTMKRSFDVGRFKVTVDAKGIPKESQPPRFKQKTETQSCDNTQHPIRCRSTTLPCPEANYTLNKERADYQKFALMLAGVKGNTRITRRSIHKKPSTVCEDSPSQVDSLQTIFEPTSVIDEDVTNKTSGRDCIHDDQTICSDQCDNRRNITDSYEMNTMNASFDDVPTSTRNTFNEELFFVNTSVSETMNLRKNTLDFDEGKRKRKAMKIKRINDEFENSNQCPDKRDDMTVYGDTTMPMVDQHGHSLPPPESLNNSSISFIYGRVNHSQYNVIYVDDNQSTCKQTSSDLQDHNDELPIITNNTALDFIEKYKG